MGIGGLRMKNVRVKHGLTFRDVERLSRILAERYRDNRYIVRISVLADIENHGTVPNVFHLHSLCVIYSVQLQRVLSWFGVHVEPSQKTVSRWFAAALAF